MFAINVIGAWVGLVMFDVVSLLGFQRVYGLVRRCPVSGRTPRGDVTPRVCRAVEEACVWYVKRAECLQRSAVTTWVLRCHGVPAELVIGYRPVPMDSHAWVEVSGRVVNDRPQYQKFFTVLDRL